MSIGNVRAMWVVMVCRLDQLYGLFCQRALLVRRTICSRAIARICSRAIVRCRGYTFLCIVVDLEKWCYRALLRALLIPRQHSIFAHTFEYVPSCCRALLRKRQERIFANMRCCPLRKRAPQQQVTLVQVIANMRCCLFRKRALQQKYTSATKTYLCKGVLMSSSQKSTATTVHLCKGTCKDAVLSRCKRAP